MSHYKQIIVLREDLCMSPGKACAQAAHASVNATVQALNDAMFKGNNFRAINEWANTGSTKIVLGVKSLAKLENLYAKCEELNSQCLSRIVEDEARNEFAEPTVTGFAIGPFPEEELDPIFKRVRLYQGLV